MCREKQQIFHENLQILHYGRPKSGVKLVPGMIFTIEPMINQGRKEVRFLSNGWTAVTKDSAPSAHFEHTIAITDKGPLILTE